MRVVAGICCNSASKWRRCKYGVPTSDKCIPNSVCRKRASGISSCESGKKNIFLPVNSTRCFARACSARFLGASIVAAKVLSGTPKDLAACSNQALVPIAPNGNGAGRWLAPKASSSRAVSAKKGWANKNSVPGPTFGMSVLRRGGKKSTSLMPILLNRLRNWSSTTSAKVPTIKSLLPSSFLAGRVGTMAARHASSPCVKVVSMPLPE